MNLYFILKEYMQLVNELNTKKNTSIHVIILSFVKIDFHEDFERIPEEKYKKKTFSYLSLETLN